MVHNKMLVVLNDGSESGVPGEMTHETAPTAAYAAPIGARRDTERRKKSFDNRCIRSIPPLSGLVKYDYHHPTADRVEALIRTNSRAVWERGQLCVTIHPS